MFTRTASFEADVNADGPFDGQNGYYYNTH